ncbi:MAG: hypothetical protein ACW98Y_20855, partial [Candidatus Thorarchaeota archaeon]
DISVFDGTGPTINNQVDVQIDEGGAGTTLSWNGTDLHPATYVIYFDDSILVTGDWNSSSEFITVDVIGLSLGPYNYTAVLTDEGSNTAVDQAIVTVIDSTLPQIDSPADVSYGRGETGHVVNWTGSDLNPATYELYIDGSLDKTDLWTTSPKVFNISVDGFAEGIHQVTLILIDIGGNSASDSVTVTVIDSTAPSINAPDDIEYTAGRVGNYFIWTVSESNPEDYTIYLDDAIVASGSLNDTSESLTVFVDGLAVGTHNYTLLVTDLIGNSAVDTVIVTVNPSTETTTTTTTTTTGTTNTTGTTGEPTDPPLSGSLDGIIIVLTYAGCIAGALIATEFYRRRSS